MVKKKLGGRRASDMRVHRYGNCGEGRMGGLSGIRQDRGFLKEPLPKSPDAQCKLRAAGKGVAMEKPLMIDKIT